MAGNAISNQFMLATATVMIGPQASLYDLNPDDHSIGLVKNFSIEQQPSYTELRQGLKNTLVDSQMTQNQVNTSMEVYEYTSKNLMYGLGLDGTAAIETEVFLSSAQGAAADTTLDIADSDDNSGEFSVGRYIYIQHPTQTDLVHVAKITTAGSHATGTTTLTFADHPIPTNVTFPIGSKVSLVNDIDVGSKVDQPYFSAKVVGPMANGGDPVILLFPKIRITRGFNLNFTTDDYGNLPFEFGVYDVTTADDFTGSSGPNLYEDFIQAPVRLMAR